MNKRPITLSIAGYDPSGGAGVLADIKTFEQHKVAGMAVTTAITYQTEDSFKAVDWLHYKQIKGQLKLIIKRYDIKYIKIGLIENLDILYKLLKYLHKKIEHPYIIWDPILRASMGYDFKHKIEKKTLKKILKYCTVITPNWREAEILTKNKDAIVACNKMAAHCIVFLKGGHNIETPATDMVWEGESLDILHPDVITNLEKHGTGCVLSAALLSNIALGIPFKLSCQLAKNYTLKYILSNNTKLGFHKI
ncbi:MAG: hydroxymethylpyrimidine/phosphomethylpyrimidine kinase [Chitinophagales bacterium]|nr:hydroxymethylpyrimidine/phosphomethylpyrimidine kinase [Chitinophagales bacterium]